MKIPSTKNELTKFIDHTLLKPGATAQDIDRHCRQAIEHKFFSVCVGPRWISPAADILRRTGVKVDATAGFPFGSETAKIKCLQAEDAIMAGADEIDMVADLAAIIEGDRRYLANEFVSVLSLCRTFRPGVILKVIIESAALTEEQIIFVSKIAADAGVDFLKTSTGLHPAGGATAAAVRLMAQSAPNCRIKAAGGIKTAQNALEMIAAGASRIGTSASVEIIQGFTETDNAGTCPK